MNEESEENSLKEDWHHFRNNQKTASLIILILVGWAVGDIIAGLILLLV